MTMDIRLARIDDRLLHGQVATVWTKETQCNRILVISDEVAKDNLRKTLITQAAPPGVKANVITIDKMIQIYQDPRFDVFKALMLFTNPEDVVRIVKGGVKLTSVNIGGMSFSDGRKMITNAVSITDEDVEAFKWLHDQGIELEVRKVAADSRVDMMDLLKKNDLI